MPNVLTTASTVRCGHGPGTVTVASTAKLTVAGAPVLLRASIQDKAVTGCGTVASSTTAPCLAVKSVSFGASAKLTCGGSAVVLETLKGTTDGTVGGVTPQLLLAATANQTKLTSV